MFIYPKTERTIFFNQDSPACLQQKWIFGVNIPYWKKHFTIYKWFHMLLCMR